MRIRMQNTIITFSVTNMSSNLLNAHLRNYFVGIKIQMVITNVLEIAVTLHSPKNLRCYSIRKNG